jgi:23S rRNA (guanosine2251-2'-O)-methyltransferase
MTSKKIYLIAQNIRSLYNVGSLFRSADVFNIDKIYLTGYTGAPPREQISKVALGAENWISFESVRHTHLLIPKLKRDGVHIYALETGKKTTDISKFKPKFPCALIIGNEVKGITKKILDLSDQVLQIPLSGKKDSLNVSVAAGIALYELNRHR